MDNRFNRIFPSFTFLHLELSPSHRIIDNLLDYFVFNVYNKQKDDKARAYQLENMVIEASSSPSTTIVVTDVLRLQKVNLVFSYFLILIFISCDLFSSFYF